MTRAQLRVLKRASANEHTGHETRVKGSEHLTARFLVHHGMLVYCGAGTWQITDKGRDALRSVRVGSTGS